MKTRIKLGKSAMDNSPMYYPQYFSEGRNIGDVIGTLSLFAVFIGIMWLCGGGYRSFVTTSVIGTLTAIWSYFHTSWCSIYFVSDHGYYHQIKMQWANYSMHKSHAELAIDNFLKNGQQSYPKDLNVINYP